jgi:hypothetical protein
VLLYNLACASAVFEIADILSLTRALQLYLIESQHPPRHPPPAINAQIAERTQRAVQRLLAPWY